MASESQSHDCCKPTPRGSPMPHRRHGMTFTDALTDLLGRADCMFLTVVSRDGQKTVRALEYLAHLDRSALRAREDAKARGDRAPSVRRDCRIVEAAAGGWELITF